MKYQVIARKFRPQAFADVVGQEPIVRTLRNAIELERIGHAYLFCGPRGVGKTTTARLLAKALNCGSGPTPTPCNACPSCTEIAAGHSIDVLEIDAASNTGVDSIRELRENARYAPSRDRFKIFIVDEVHMLSTSAFNALLKILEEPPGHIVFILATTERHKLPGTILSRCQQFVFRTIPPAEIHDHLRRIAARENVTVGEEALAYVVKAAEGSMRDAQSLLDQIIAFGGQEVTGDDVRNALGFIPADLIDGAVRALVERDPRALIEITGVVVDQGMSLQQFVREFVARVRDVLLAKLGLADRILGGPEGRAAVQELADRLSEQDLIRYIDALLRLENDLRWTAEPRFHVEIACVKLAKLGQLRDLEDVLRELGGGAGPAATARPRPDSEAEPDRRPAPRPSPPPDPEPAPKRVIRSVESIQEPAAPEAPAQARTAESETPSRIMGAVPGASLRQSAENESLVKSFLDVFKGEIAHVRSADEPESGSGG